MTCRRCDQTLPAFWSVLLCWECLVAKPGPEAVDPDWPWHAPVARQKAPRKAGGPAGHPL